MRTIVFVSTASKDALLAAKKLGLRVILVYDEELDCGADYVEQQLWFDPHDIHCAQQAIAALQFMQPLHGVITTDERAVPFAGAISEGLHLPGNTYEASYAARNKFVMRQRLSQHGVPCPVFGVARTLPEARSLAGEIIGFPLVLKPLFGTVGQGVLRVNDPAELEAYFPIVKRVSESYDYFVKDDQYRDYVLLEQYMEGREMSLNGLISEGRIQWIGTLDKPNPLQGPTFEETILLTPSREPAELLREVFAMAERGVSALGLWHGTLHAELRLTAAGPRILEIAARPIGGICGRAHTFCLGSDYYEMVIQNTLGDKVPVPRDEIRPAGVMMIPVPKSGRFVTVRGVDEARRVAGVSEVSIAVRAGQVISTFPEQGYYIGFILASGASADDVEQSLNMAHSLLTFEIEPIEAEIAAQAPSA
jgi:biotin carboxylase